MPIFGSQIKNNSLNLEKLSSGTNFLPTNASLGSVKTTFSDNEFVTKRFILDNATANLIINAPGLVYDSTSGILSLSDGYIIPTIIDISNGNTAYNWGDHSTAGYSKTFNFDITESGTDFNISVLGDVYSFNLPIASATKTGKLSSDDYIRFSNSVSNISGGTNFSYFTTDGITPYWENQQYTGQYFLVNNSAIKDNLNTVDIILNKLAPPKPPKLNDASTIAAITGSGVSGIKTSSGGSVTNIYSNTASRGATTFTFDITHSKHNSISPASNNFFYLTDDVNESLTLSVYEGLNLIRSVSKNALLDTAANGSGTNSGLNISSLVRQDYFLGVSGKSDFWMSYNMQGGLNIIQSGGNSISPTTNDYSIIFLHKDNMSDIGDSNSSLFRIENGNLVPIVSGLNITFPSMTSYVSGLPSLAVSQVINISGTINNGIKFYYPSTIGTSTVTATNAGSNTLSGVQTTNSSYNYSANHTILAGQYSESISYSITPYDVFGSGTTSSNSTSGFRVDTVSLAKLVLDASLGGDNFERRLSPTTSSLYEAESASVYDATAHINSLNTGSGVYFYQLQLLNGIYRYPTGSYTGANFLGWRYADFQLKTITNQTNLDLTINGASGISGITGTANFRLFIKVSGATGWLDANAAWSSGTPVLDGAAAVDVGNSTSATVRRITFGNTISGNVFVRIGIFSGSAIQFTSLSHNK